MRTTRTTTISIVAAGLLAVMAVGASAQEPEGESWPRLTTDHVYGDDDSSRQVVHVLEPEPREAPRPAVVFFHGGGLIMGNPMWDIAEAQAMAKLGYVTFMAGYRLFDQYTGENPWPAQLDDAQSAIRWVRANADRFNADPERVCAIGFSAGGHLSGLLGTTDAADDPAEVSSRVDCSVAISGDGDLTVPYDDPRWADVFRDMFGGTLEEIPEVWRAASPAHNVDEDTVPFLIVHGNRDEDVPVVMSRSLADALAEAGTEYVFVEVPAGHMDVRRPRATNAVIEAFLASQLRPER